jgi:outer membrane autotransporter protein
MSGFSFDPAWVRILPANLAGLRGAVAALGLVVALTSPSHAQVVNLGTAADFAVLGGSTVTNTGTSILTGNLGVSPGSAITGFPPGIVTPPGATHAADAVAIQAQSDLTAAYLSLLSRPTTANLTGQNLGGLTLTPGVYSFDSSAQLTGALTLNALGNPNAVFIFKIGSTLTTASSSTVTVINGGPGSNVFWRIGSSATLGTTTSFVGDILAQTSITLNTGANIACGSALAQTGAVTLDTNRISIGNLAPCMIVAPPTGTVVVVPPGTVLPPGAVPVVVPPGVVLPPGETLVAIFPTRNPQLSGEIGTDIAQAGTQAMNSFLSLLTNPFNASRGVAPEIPLPPRPMLIYKAPVYKAPVGAAPDPRRWSIWGAAYGGQYRASGDPSVGSHDFSARTFGYATGLDYRVTPNTVVGFALAGGGTNFGLSDGLGNGRSDMFQAAVYSTTHVNAAYVSAAFAYAWHRVSTDRIVTLAGTDDLTANFSANNIGGRIEGGYRFAIPGVFDSSGFGLTPYAALQWQAFHTPSYSEIAASGSSTYALAYNAQTTTTTRGELGSWVDKTYTLDRGNAFTLFGRAAWAHDWFSDPSVTAGFVSLPGSIFTVIGAAPAHDSLLVSAGAQISFTNGISLLGRFDSEFSQHSQTYIGTAQLRYAF